MLNNCEYGCLHFPLRNCEQMTYEKAYRIQEQAQIFKVFSQLDQTAKHLNVVHVPSIPSKNTGNL